MKVKKTPVSQPDLEASKPNFKESLQRVWGMRPYFLPYLPIALCVLALAWVQADINLSAASLTKQILDSLNPEPTGVPPTQNIGNILSRKILEAISTGAGILQLACILIVFLVTSSALSILAEQIRVKIGLRSRTAIQKDILSGLTRETGGARNKRQTGATSTIITQDASGLSTFLNFGLLGVAEQVVKFGIYTYGIFQIPAGGIILAIILPVSIVLNTLVVKLFYNWEGRINRENQKHMIDSRTSAVSFFNIISRLVYLGGDKKLSANLVNKFERAGEANAKYQLVTSYRGAIMTILTTLSLPIVVLVAGSYKSLNITAGDIIQTQGILMLILAIVGSLTGFPNMLEQYAPGIERVASILGVRPVADKPARLEQLLRQQAPPSIHFEGLNFCYADSSEPLFSDFNLTIPAGALVGIVGAPGCGKSTLGRILIGDEIPSSGTITIESEPVTDWHLLWRRELIGFLPAEQGMIAPGTIRENIEFGRQIPEQQLEQAIHDSGFSDILNKTLSNGEKRFPKGLDTYMDDPEKFLSSGQRRILGVARLLAGTQKIRIFDEPGSQLSGKAMNEVATALRKVCAGHTAIIITHDPDVFQTDFNIFLDGGRVADLGSHQELFSRNSDYHSLVNKYQIERENPAVAKQQSPLRQPLE